MRAARPHRLTGLAQVQGTFGLLAMAILLFPAFGACQHTVLGPTAPDPVVAKVNGKAITDSAIKDEIEEIYPANTAHGGLRPQKLQEVRSKALEELIVRELAFQQAEKTHTVVPIAAAQAEFKRLRTQAGAQRFDMSLHSSGVSRLTYISRLQRQMTLEKIYKARVIQPAQVAPAALRKYYDENSKKFFRPEQAHVRIFLAELGQTPTPEDVSKAQSKADKVYAQLQAGKEFGPLAEQFSDDAYRVKGGDLGWVHRGRLEPEFEKVAFGLRPGEFSKPFRTPYGITILKLEAYEPGRQMTFEKISPILQQELVQKNAMELRHAWITELRKDAKIEILDKELSPPAAASLKGTAG